VLEEHRTETASNLLAHILFAIKSHTGTAEQSDDITIVVMKRSPIAGENAI